MRVCVIVSWVALFACAGAEPARVSVPARAVAAVDPPPASARLVDGVTPIGYDLTLEVDPAHEAFTGHVAITIAVATPDTQRLWLHAAELAISRATLTRGGHVEPVEVIAGGGPLQGFGLARVVGAGETVTLTIDYTGRAPDRSGRTRGLEGLFRQRAAGRWYLYSQAESTFARKIVPCFDEPRFKPAWRVTTVVPRGQLALGNAPVLAERERPDGRHEVQFAEIVALPSHLLAIAVGPFELVEVGALGRNHVPVRLAVIQGDGPRTAPARRVVPAIIDALERYFDEPLPLAKLDLVAVPTFFGAMENPGLITFASRVLIGGRDLTQIAAHELAHQWFGNAVTPAWWDDLWLAEAFATWLGERVTHTLDGARPPELAHRTRAVALAADDEIDAGPLAGPVAADDVEPAFDTIAYDKGAAVLRMFERFVGPAAFQAAVRGYVAANAGRAVTAQAFLDALAAASRPEVGAALASNLAHAGTPVVELAVRCGAAPVIVASVRDQVTLPVCVRAAPATRLCFLAGAHTEQALPVAAGCPAWLVGNDGGHGYYRVAWRASAAAPLAVLSPDERLARGDDLAAAVQHGELPIAAALGELTTLARSGDPYGERAALTIARAIDPLVEDRLRPAWTAWLGDRFAHRLTARALATLQSPADLLLRDELVELARDAVELARDAADPAARAAARDAVLRQIDDWIGGRIHGGLDGGLGGDLGGRLDDLVGGRLDDLLLGQQPVQLELTELRLATASDATALFDRLLDAAADPARPARSGSRTSLAPSARAGALLAALGAFPAAFAPRVVDVAFDPRFSSDHTWPALLAILGRAETAAAAWRAFHGRLDDVEGGFFSPWATHDLIVMAAALCEAGARAQVAADFAPRIARIEDRAVARVVAARLSRALATIDRCIARRAALGDVAAALATARGGPSTPRR